MLEKPNTIAPTYAGFITLGNTNTNCWNFCRCHNFAKSLGKQKILGCDLPIFFCTAEKRQKKVPENYIIIRLKICTFYEMRIFLE